MNTLSNPLQPKTFQIAYFHWLINKKIENGDEITLLANHIREQANSSAMSDDAAASKIAMVRQRWEDFAVRFTTTANKRVTLQCAQQMHAYLHLDKAQSVLEVAAGAALGSLDIAERMTNGDALDGEKKKLVVTDLSPTMVGLASETMKNVSSERLEVDVQVANGEKEHHLDSSCVFAHRNLYHELTLASLFSMITQGRT